MSSRIETVTSRLLDPFRARLVGLVRCAIPNRDESIAAARASFRVQDPTLQAALQAEVAAARPEPQPVPTLPDELLIRFGAYGGRSEELLGLLDADRKIRKGVEAIARGGLSSRKQTVAKERIKDGVVTLLEMRARGFRGIEVGKTCDDHAPNRDSRDEVLVVNGVLGTSHRFDASYQFDQLLTETGLGDADGPHGGYDFINYGGVNQLGLESRQTVFKGQW